MCVYQRKTERDRESDIYTYIEIERERERENVCVYVHARMCACMCSMYTYQRRSRRRGTMFYRTMFHKTRLCLVIQVRALSKVSVLGYLYCISYI
jgi:hypothetical protein